MKRLVLDVLKTFVGCIAFAGFIFGFGYIYKAGETAFYKVVDFVVAHYSLSLLIMIVTWGTITAVVFLFANGGFKRLKIWFKRRKRRTLYVK